MCPHTARRWAALSYISLHSQAPPRLPASVSVRAPLSSTPRAIFHAFPHHFYPCAGTAATSAVAAAVPRSGAGGARTILIPSAVTTFHDVDVVKIEENQEDKGGYVQGKAPDRPLEEYLNKGGARTSKGNKNMETRRDTVSWQVPDRPNQNERERGRGIVR